jgi:hypothetical protein
VSAEIMRPASTVRLSTREVDVIAALCCGLTNKEIACRSLDQIIYEVTRGVASPPPGTQVIALTKGFFALVDSEDFERLNAVKWHATIGPSGNVYPARSLWKDGRRTRARMHEDILLVPPGLFCDHIDCNGLNNRRNNLRAATRAQNGQNRCGWAASGLPKGVSAHHTRFRAGIRVNKKRLHLGVFETIHEAAAAYDEAAKKYFGEFARLNLPGAMADGAHV